MAVAMLIGNVPMQFKNKCSGFTYIGVLMLVAISGIGLAGVGIVWHQDAQREREKELLFIGEEFRLAIGSYYENTPSGTKQYPKKLDDLILDNRFPITKRHLRKLYTDPFANEDAWGLVLQQGQIIGVYSTSELAPIKTTGFLPQYETFGAMAKYSEWKFTYTPGSMPLMGGG
ncbi:MAG: type II secretion system protein [Methylotenera sp.]|nr:type II secretion system protein [Methylotenera sp.]MDZ4222335.1 type II secretion system protein [Methylotenera sp.]